MILAPVTGVRCVLASLPFVTVGPLGAASYRANLVIAIPTPPIFDQSEPRQQVPPWRLCLQGGNFLEMAEARRGSTLCPGEFFIAELERDCSSPPARLSKSYGPKSETEALGLGAMQCTGWRLDTSFVLDGEAVLLGVDGRSDFDGLHSRRHDAEVEFYAFDILVSDGEDRPQAAAEHAQDQPGPAAGPPRRRHLPFRFRAGRDRP